MSRLVPAVLVAGSLVAAAGSAQAQEGMAWTYARSVAANPLDTILNLAFGVPETDDMRAFITCSIGANWIYGDVNLGAPVDGLPDDAQVSVSLHANGYDSAIDGRVQRMEEGIWGVNFAVGLDDPFWLALMAGGDLRYSVNGRGAVVLPLAGASEPAHAFLGDCLSIGALTPDAPQAPAK